jgi:hypothetical protein
MRNFLSSFICKVAEACGLSHVNPRKLPLAPSASLGQIETGEEKSGSEYASLIGSLVFLAIATRPDLISEILHVPLKHLVHTWGLGPLAL